MQVIRVRNANYLGFRSDCPSRQILDQIADKWSMMVMAVLLGDGSINGLRRGHDDPGYAKPDGTNDQACVLLHTWAKPVDVYCR